MKIKKISLFLLIAVMMSVMASCSSKKSAVGEPVYTSHNPHVAKVADALAGYTDWKTVRMSGKLHLSSLPISPSLKIYMKKGSELTISASAIFVGEVFRVELSEDSIFMVNKLKKEYCKESGDNLKEFYPSFCEELQSLLLGSMIVPGNGTLSESNMDKVAIETENEIRKVTPDLGELPLGSAFFYLLDWRGRISDIIVDGDRGKRLFSLSYDWKTNGSVEMTSEISKGNKPIKIEIDLDAPKWGEGPLAPFKLGKGYKPVTIQDFFKSI